MRVRSLVAFIFLQSVPIGVVLALILDFSIWAGLLMGVFFGAGQASLLIVGDQKGWLRKGRFGKHQPPRRHQFSRARLVYGIGLALALGVLVGIISDYSLALWLVWIPALVLLGILFAWMLARAG